MRIPHFTDLRVVQNTLSILNRRFRFFVNPTQVEVLYEKLTNNNFDIYKVNPHLIIKYNNSSNGLILTNSFLEKYSWFSTIGIQDPFLKEFKMVELVKGCLVSIVCNEFCSFNYDGYYSYPPKGFIYYRDDPNYPMYHLLQDNNRFIAGHPAPFKRFTAEDLLFEKERLIQKRISISHHFTTSPERYFKNPHRYEENLIRFFCKYYHNSNKFPIHELLSKHHVINFGSKYGIRFVKTKIEQYVWEDHVLKYAGSPYYRNFLNEIIYNDDDLFCQIMVPPIYYKEGIRRFINRLYYYPRL